MVITVIGHLCKDIIHLPHGDHSSHVESFGGIFYSVAALSCLMGEKDVIQPVFGVGQSDYDALIERLSRYKNVDTKGIFKFKGPTNSVHLFYHADNQSRIECSKDISVPIPFSRIKSSLDADGILINMISGSDITLETLDMIRIETREQHVPIHFDFQSLTLGIDQEFKRFRRPLTDWRRWCFMLHSIQMSQEEALGLSAERFDEPTLINHLMSLMVDTLLITRGSKGATAIVQDIHKTLTRRDLDAVPMELFKNPTGCGDVFGAAFLYSYLKKKNSFAAAEFANKAAALNTTIQTADELETLAEQFKNLNGDKKGE
jgi:sugar/nucleoside kinase (ribokinase family)